MAYYAVGDELLVWSYDEKPERVTVRLDRKNRRLIVEHDDRCWSLLIWYMRDRRILHRYPKKTE